MNSDPRSGGAPATTTTIIVGSLEASRPRENRQSGNGPNHATTATTSATSAATSASTTTTPATTAPTETHPPSPSRYGDQASCDNESHNRNAITISSTSSTTSATAETRLSDTVPPEDEQRNRNTYCICNQSVAEQNRIVCAGTCEGCYHPDCTNTSTPLDVWYCLQCSIT